MFARTPFDALGQRPLRFLTSAWPWRSVAYVLSSLPFSVVVLAGVGAGVTLGDQAGLVVVVVLVAVLAGTVPAVIGRYERWRLRLVDRDPIPLRPRSEQRPRSDRRSGSERKGRPGPRAVERGGETGHMPEFERGRETEGAPGSERGSEVEGGPGGGRGGGGPRYGSWAWMRAETSYGELGYGMISLLALWWIDLGVLALSVSLPVTAMTALLQPSRPPAALAVTMTLAGVILLPLAAYVVTAWAGARAAMARSILDPPDEELGEVIRSRARLVDAFEAERRRIERDLHDGAQQRLVTLTMTLGVARLDLPPDSPAVRHIDEAHEQAKRALAEIRELIRGVHPPVLADRGLAAAVRDLAGRAQVPVDVDVELPWRPPPAAEATAYFAVSEALANVAKHSSAGRAWVRARLTESADPGGGAGMLTVEIGDDGAGGADPAAGTGLTGLADRVAVQRGGLYMSSPPGGPTLLRVEIPCEPTTTASA